LDDAFGPVIAAEYTEEEKKKEKVFTHWLVAVFQALCVCINYLIATVLYKNDMIKEGVKKSIFFFLFSLFVYAW